MWGSCRRIMWSSHVGFRDEQFAMEEAAGAGGGGAEHHTGERDSPVVGRVRQTRTGRGQGMSWRAVGSRVW